MSQQLRLGETLRVHTNRVSSAAWKPGTHTVFAFCCKNDTVRVWEKPRRSGFVCKEVLERGQTGAVSSFTWSPCGNKLAIGSMGGLTSIWRNNTGEFTYVCTLQKRHRGAVNSISWHNSGTLLATCGGDKAVRIWRSDPEAEEEDHFVCQAELKGHTGDVTFVLWHPDYNVLFSCSSDTYIKVWAEEDYDEGDEIDWVFKHNFIGTGHTSTVRALSFSPDREKMVSCSDDRSIKIWKWDTRYSGYDSRAPWMAFITITDLHTRAIYSVHWSRDGTIATGARDGAIRMVDVEGDGDSVDDYNPLPKKDDAHAMAVNSVQWNPTDEHQLLSASDDGSIKIWEI